MVKQIRNPDCVQDTSKNSQTQPVQPLDNLTNSVAERTYWLENIDFGTLNSYLETPKCFYGLGDFRVVTTNNTLLYGEYTGGNYSRSSATIEGIRVVAESETIAENVLFYINTRKK